MKSILPAWIRITLIFILGLTVGLECKTAHAQNINTTFTQLGTWDCTFPQPGYNVPLPAGLYTCPEQITFPAPFGGNPTVILTGCTVYTGIASGTPTHCKGFMVSPPSSTGLVPMLNLNEWGPWGAFGNNPVYPVRISGTWVAVGPILITGTVVPKYLVLTVIYAPPGTNGGHSTSSVSYGAGSSTGTTTSSSQTFKVSNSVSFEASGGILGNGGGAGISFAYSRASTDSQSLEIKKSTSATINQAGPAQDGVSHDEDEIWLLLNPTVNLALSSSSAAWTLANATPSPVQYVHVGWLNGHQPMPAGVAAALQSGGITSQDFPNILARDPLAGGSSSLDPTRFVSLNTTFPYEPPYSANDPVPTVTFNISNSSTTTTGSAVEDTYTVGLTTSLSGNYLEFAKATLKDTASWEWTNKSSQSIATGTSQSATLTVGGPAYGYTGGTVMQAYLDTMYNTFVFSIVPVAAQEIGVDGTLVNRSGKPIPFTEVTLVEVETGIQHRTFTNAKGEYKFVGRITGPARIQTQAVGVTQMLPRTGSTTARHVPLRLP
jgi:hypothetical protein